MRLSIQLAVDTGSSSSDLVTKNGRIFVTGVEPGAVVEYTVDRGVTWNLITGSSFSITGDDGYFIEARQTSTLGAVTYAQPLDIILDNSAPEEPILWLEQDTGEEDYDFVTSNGIINISGLEPSDRWQWSANSIDWQTGSGESFVAPDGTRAVYIQTSDLAGNTTLSTPFAVVVDNARPDAPLFGPTEDGGVSATDGVTSSEELEFLKSEQMLGVFSLDGGLTWQDVNTDFALPSDGVHKVLVKQRDLAGNVSEATQRVLVLDRTPPAAPILGLVDRFGDPDYLQTTTGVVTVKGLETGGAWGYQEYGTTDMIKGVGNTITVRGLGLHELTVFQVDAAGNESEAGQISFTLESDNYNGWADDDTLTGSAAAEATDAGVGDDRIIGFQGADTLEGGSGIDTLVVRGSMGDLNAALDGQLSGVEIVTGSASTMAIWLNLGEQTESLRVIGSAFDDRLTGGAGNDTQIGGTGKDKINGGSGNDSLSGGRGADTLAGGYGDDTATGGAGRDQLAGGVGNDKLWGGLNNDLLRGGGGSDALVGGAGADQLLGGTGDDTLIGGAGADRYAYSALPFGRDVIVGFGDTAGNQDLIEFAKAIYADFSGVRAAMLQVGADVVISSGSESITIKAVDLSSLDASDFAFV